MRDAWGVVREERFSSVGLRVDAELAPPCCFIAVAVNLAMVNTAERHGELIAHFATERARFGLLPVPRTPS
jgi:hypothetical protein